MGDSNRQNRDAARQRKPRREDREMKVLTATRQTQGWRKNDYSWTVDGELVLLVPGECSGGSVDDGCGCRRGMSGMVSHRATTTMKVVDRNDLDPDSYPILIVDALQSQGYLKDVSLADPEVSEWVQELNVALMNLADSFPVGTVVERRGDVLVARPRPQEGT
jgi:hypothetical protein